VGFLRDSVWQGVGAVAGVLALIVAVLEVRRHRRRRDDEPSAIKLFDLSTYQGSVTITTSWRSRSGTLNPRYTGLAVDSQRHVTRNSYGRW
jgi:hypothetical protein